MGSLDRTGVALDGTPLCSFSEAEDVVEVDPPVGEVVGEEGARVTTQEGSVQAKKRHRVRGMRFRL